MTTHTPPTTSRSDEARFGLGALDARRRRSIIIGMSAAAVLFAAAAVVALTQLPAALMIITVAIAGIAAVVLFWSLPVTWLPASSVVLYALIPAQLLIRVNTIPLLGVPIVIWVIRRLILQRRGGRPAFTLEHRLGSRFWVLLTAVAFLAWLLATVLWSEDPVRSVIFVAAIGSAVMAILVVLEAREEARLLAQAWVLVGAAAGLYAVLEFFTQFNPVADALSPLFDIATRTWAVYRSQVWFVHPLYASAYLCIAATLAIGLWLQLGHRRYFIAGAVTSAGVVATGSRGSLVALAVALAVVWLVALLRTRPLPTVKLGLAAVFGVVGTIVVLGLPTITERSTSVEAERSAEARAAGVDYALRAAADHGWVGSGGFTSGDVFDRYASIPLESGYLQLLISIGVPGLVLFGLFLVAVAGAGVVAREPAAVGSLVACAIVLGTFNAIDDIPGHLLLYGYTAFLCVASPTWGMRPAYGGLFGATPSDTVGSARFAGARS